MLSVRLCSVLLVTTERPPSPWQPPQRAVSRDRGGLGHTPGLLPFGSHLGPPSAGHPDVQHRKRWEGEPAQHRPRGLPPSGPWLWLSAVPVAANVCFTPVLTLCTRVCAYTAQLPGPTRALHTVSGSPHGPRVRDPGQARCRARLGLPPSHN